MVLVALFCCPVWVVSVSPCVVRACAWVASGNSHVLYKSELQKHFAAMSKITEDHPEASAVVQDTIDFMFGQHRTIEFLSRALASICAEIKALL